MRKKSASPSTENRSLEHAAKACSMHCGGMGFVFRRCVITRS